MVTRAITMLRDLDMTDIAVDYIVVDTVRVARETFAHIWEAWRDGAVREAENNHAPIPILHARK